MSEGGRANQRRRTRKDLLRAAARLLKLGCIPTMAEVADEALVSRATAYRYFPSSGELLLEAPIDGAVPTPQSVFADDSSSDPVERVDRAERALHSMVYENESQLRLMLAQSLQQCLADGVPVRQNRRLELIEEALAPARGRFDDDVYQRLCAALALVFGPESMVVFSDVMQIDEAEARQVKSWAVNAFVRGALSESRAG